MAFPDGLEMGYKRRTSIRDDFMVWGLSKKSGGYFQRGGRLLWDGK